ncbi:MAG: SDR family oxidoreductase [bacterium]|nr:SDR family oxidoreductase [bacterium]
MNKSIIGITGAAGVIGSVLSKNLKEEYNLKLFDKKVQNKDMICVDLSDKKSLKGVFDNIDILIHLAADPSPVASDESIRKNNFMATSNVFLEAEEAGVRKIIYASSNCIHQGDIVKALQNRLGYWKTVIPFNAHPSPNCLYAESKIFGENLGRHFSYSGTQFIAMRIGWVFKNDVINEDVNIDSEYFRAIYCSNRDLIEAFRRAIDVDVKFMSAYVVSNNDRGVFDMTETNRLLGFYPKDNSAHIRK